MGGFEKWEIGSATPPEHQDRPDAPGEEHGEPGEVAVGRAVVVVTEADVAELGERDDEEEGEPERYPEDEEPAEVRHHPRSAQGEDGVRLPGVEQQDDENEDHQSGGHEEDGGVRP